MKFVHWCSCVSKLTIFVLSLVSPAPSWHKALAGFCPRPSRQNCCGLNSEGTFAYAEKNSDSNVVNLLQLSVSSRLLLYPQAAWTESTSIYTTVPDQHVKTVKTAKKRLDGDNADIVHGGKCGSVTQLWKPNGGCIDEVGTPVEEICSSAVSSTLAGRSREAPGVEQQCPPERKMGFLWERWSWGCMSLFHHNKLGGFPGALCRVLSTMKGVCENNLPPLRDHTLTGRQLTDHKETSRQTDVLIYCLFITH